MIGANQRLKLTGAAILVFRAFNAISGGPGSLAVPLAGKNDALAISQEYAEMSHRLCPPEGRAFLDPEEIVERLREEFAFCDADKDQGADDVGDIIAKLIELKAPQAIIDAVLAGRERSYSVTVADDMASEDYLNIIVRPDEGPLIGYHSAQHEAAVRSLVERCVRALDYELFPV